MASVNFLQRVGASSCIRCDFKTDSSQSFEEQDAAMIEHLTAEHPNWMGDGAKSIPVAQDKKFHFEDEQVMNALVGTEYLRDAVQRRLTLMTSGEKRSLYRAIATLVSSQEST